ncbi:universal stress protein [uncultured Castellaniella sp.]|uniref:universal stress protein n=1 Tax=uncultured Castellaniella sp. TaxID=647907 RepID=UPI002619887E|nr:universal stress protein [uncultured Castellaniella sp.]
MYKRILVPLDGSPFSEEMIPYAAGLAAVHGTELALLRIVDKAADQDDARDYIDWMASRHGAEGLCLVDAGDAARAILEEAARKPATLLAMTSRGRSGLMELVLGSVAQRVVRGANGPVLVYRPTGARAPDHAPVKLRSVVLPLDGSTLPEALASDAARFAGWIGAGLEVVSAVQTVDAAKVGEISGGEMSKLESGYVHTQAVDLAKRHGVAVDWEVLHGDPVTAIADHVSRRGDVILAMVTRRRDAIEAALLGSVTSGCLRKAGVPILMRLP